jgi:hypothetical protein
MVPDNKRVVVVRARIFLFMKFVCEGSPEGMERKSIFHSQRILQIQVVSPALLTITIYVSTTGT